MVSFSSPESELDLALPYDVGEPEKPRGLNKRGDMANPLLETMGMGWVFGLEGAEAGSRRAMGRGLELGELLMNERIRDAIYKSSSGSRGGGSNDLIEVGKEVDSPKGCGIGPDSNEGFVCKAAIFFSKESIG